MDYENKIDIPFGAKDSELKGWEYTIPEGMEAIIKDGKVIVREKESDVERIERIRKKIITLYSDLEAWTTALFNKARSDKDSEAEGKALFKMKGLMVALSYIGDYLEKQKESKKPNIELIQHSWYREGYNDREFGKEPKWIIKTGDGGPKYEENPKYGKPLSKEQNPIEPSDDELQRHQNELYDFKVFAAKQAKEHHIHISFVHDFEWHNFCAELLSYFNEKHTTDGKAMLHVAEKSYQIGLRDGRMEQKPAEWSEEDERNFHWISVAIQERHLTPEYTKEVHRILSWLKSLRPQPQGTTHRDVLHSIYNLLKDYDFTQITPEHRVSLLNEIRVRCKHADEWAEILDEPHWKPSEEQMNAIYEAAQRLPIDRENGNCLYNLYDELQKLM